VRGGTERVAGGGRGGREMEGGEGGKEEAGRRNRVRMGEGREGREVGGEASREAK
jgi:hypothetical protein